MTIELNGTPHETAEGTTLAALLAELGLQPRGVAVAIDNQVVPKDKWAETVLAEGAQLMLIHAVSGG